MLRVNWCFNQLLLIGNLEQKDEASHINPLRVSFTDPRLKIYGPHGVLGRAVVIHRDEGMCHEM
jgi:hypothetical protein